MPSKNATLSRYPLTVCYQYAMNCASPMRLTLRRERFAREFVVDYNATAAAKRAGYSAHTAHAQGHRLISNADVAGRIAELQAEQRMRLNYDADRVVRLLEAAYMRAMAAGRPLAAMDAAERLGRHLGLFAS